MNKNAVLAVFKRNLASYFGSPAGYVFICAFLLASGLAAFWPQEFFNANNANLDQLNSFLPHILLGFIPAITMSIWADERRQGTDELLLTLPGSDLDVVIGKYLGAVAIFSASLVVSLVANSLVLYQLGNPDLGLLFANYTGFWFIGLAMLAIGMVASFLTANLTVAFVLGVAFNAPFALLTEWNWGITENFKDFARGVISLSGVAFFLSLAAAMLYLCAILIGRRNWMGSQNSSTRISHYAARTLAALIIGFSATSFFRNHDVVRLDSTFEGLSKLSEGSLNLLNEVNGTVIVDAYVSPAEDFPEEYVQVRANLVSLLKEMENEASDKIRVNFYEFESTDPIATTAEEEGVQNKNREGLWVEENGRGKVWDKDLYMGLVFKGPNGKKTLDFLYKGLPVEYEIMRNVVSVGAPVKKKKIGVITTDAPMMGRGPMMGPMGMMPMGGGQDPWDFILELRKQYEVESVDMEGAPPVKGEFDSLLVVQPSTLDDAKLDFLLSAIRAGVPTAIFEDPLPLINGSFTGTYEPRRSQQQGGPGQPPPTPPSKGDLSQLWKLIGVQFNANPTDRLKASLSELEKMESIATETLAGARTFPPVAAFFGKLNETKSKIRASLDKLNAGSSLTESDFEVDLEALRKTVRDEDAGLTYDHRLRRYVEQLVNDVDTQLKGLEKRILRDPYNPFPKIDKGGENFPDEFIYVQGEGHPTSKAVRNLLLTCSGSLFDAGLKNLSFTPLLKTSGYEDTGATSLDDFWTGGFMGQARRFNPDRTTYDGIGVPYVTAAAITGKVNDGNVTNDLQVIVVADADLLAAPFYGLRREPNPNFPLDVDNVMFSLNVMDQLTGEHDILNVRNRRREHRSLIRIEKIQLEAQREANEEINKAQTAFNVAVREVQRKQTEDIQKVMGRKGSMGLGEFITLQNATNIKWEDELKIIQAKESRKLKKAMTISDRKRDAEIEEGQNLVKSLAVFLPPIPLLLIALFVFSKKRMAELDGAVSNRVRRS